jgi:hypothetical protein
LSSKRRNFRCPWHNACSQRGLITTPNEHAIRLALENRFLGDTILFDCREEHSFLSHLFSWNASGARPKMLIETTMIVRSRFAKLIRRIDHELASCRQQSLELVQSRIDSKQMDAIGGSVAFSSKHDLGCVTRNYSALFKQPHDTCSRLRARCEARCFTYCLEKKARCPALLPWNDLFGEVTMVFGCPGRGSSS